MVQGARKAQPARSIPSGVDPSMEGARRITVPSRPLLIVTGAGMNEVRSAPRLAPVCGFVDGNTDDGRAGRVIECEPHKKHIAGIVPGDGRVRDPGPAGQQCKWSGVVPM